MADTMHDARGTELGLNDPLVVVSSDSHVSPSLEILAGTAPVGTGRTSTTGWSPRKPSHEESRKRFVFDGDDGLPEIHKIHTWNLQTKGHYEMSARLCDMNSDGVAAEVIFHGSAPFEPIPFMATSIGIPIDDFEHSAVGQRMYNEWLAEFCADEPERHVGLAQLPMWDIEASMTEVKWARSAGLRGVNFPQVRSEITPYEDPAWDGFWSLCEDLEMPLANHGGGGASTPLTTGPMALHIYSAESNALSRISPVVRFVFGGISNATPS